MKETKLLNRRDILSSELDRYMIPEIDEALCEYESDNFIEDEAKE